MCPTHLVTDFTQIVPRSFSKSLGLLLAGAVAYYALLSLLAMIIRLGPCYSIWFAAR